MGDQVKYRYLKMKLYGCVFCFRSYNDFKLVVMGGFMFRFKKEVITKTSKSLSGQIEDRSETFLFVISEAAMGFVVYTACFGMRFDIWSNPITSGLV